MTPLAWQVYADAVVDMYQDGDTIWIHDYHLLLLPRRLRQALPNCKIGFSLHIPFPTSELFRVLSHRTKKLRSVLSADLVSFHNFRSATHFLRSCEHALGVQGSYDGVNVDNHFCHIQINQIGIQPSKIVDAASQPALVSRVRAMREQHAHLFKGRTVLLGIDRLDIFKGLGPKLLALESMLTRYPEFRQKVLLIQVGPRHPPPAPAPPARPRRPPPAEQSLAL